MRKQMISATGLLLTFLFFSATSFGQYYAHHNTFLKATLVDFMSMESKSEKDMATVSIDANFKLQKAFNRQFKNASNVNWYNLKKQYLAVFDNEGKKTRALFTKNGYNIYAIAYGGEKDLPKDYRKSLKSNYVDFEILNVAEVRASIVKHSTWLATLKDENNLVVARIIDGGLDEFARYDTKPKMTKKQRRGRIIIPNE